MSAIRIAVDNAAWLKVEPAGWIRPVGWVMVALAILIWPFRLYPFYWATGLLVSSVADLVIVSGLCVLAALEAVVLFSQPRMAEAEKESGSVEIERGWTEVEEVSIPFADISAVTTGSHPLCPLFKRVVIGTKAGKKVPFMWTGDAEEADSVAAKLRALVGVPEEAPAAPAEAADQAEDASA